MSFIFDVDQPPMICSLLVFPPSSQLGLALRCMCLPFAIPSKFCEHYLLARMSGITLVLLVTNVRRWSSIRLATFLWCLDGPLNESDCKLYIHRQRLSHSESSLDFKITHLRHHQDEPITLFTFSVIGLNWDAFSISMSNFHHALKYSWFIIFGSAVVLSRPIATYNSPVELVNNYVHFVSSFSIESYFVQLCFEGYLCDIDDLELLINNVNHTLGDCYFFLYRILWILFDPWIGRCHTSRTGIFCCLTVALHSPIQGPINANVRRCPPAHPLQ